MTQTTGKSLLQRIRKASAEGSSAHPKAPDAAPATPGAPERSSRLSAALIVNPYSSGMAAKREREIVRLLREQVDVEVLRTERPGHAVELAAHAREAGADLVLACGGDGTANEALNGLAVGENTADERPLFGIVPAGGTNVVCRSLGLPNHPVAATRTVLEAVAERRSTTINLGRMDERLFLFASGVGFDGEVVKRIESRRSGRRPGDLAHAMVVSGMFVHEKFRFDERMTIHVGDEELRASILMCGNTTPFSYIGKLPLHLMPDCKIDAGLDFIAPRRLNVFMFMRASLGAIGKRGGKRDAEAVPASHQHHHDIQQFTVTCDEPLPVQVDGEFVGERTHIRYEVIRNPIRLVF